MRELLRSHYKSFSKFSVVGAVNTVIDFSIFFVLHDLFAFGRVFANSGAFLCAWANSFVFNALWTFDNLKKDQLKKQVFSFFIIGLIGLGLSNLTIYFAGFYIDAYMAKILAMFVSFSWSYIGSWLFVFKD